MSVVPRAYDNIHRTVKRRYGPATDHTCLCGEPAVEWAYQFTAGDQELRDDKGRFPHSLNIEDYAAMCRSCHRQLDLDNNGGRPRRGEKSSGIPVEKSPGIPVSQQRRQCLQCGLVGAPGAMGNHQRWYRHTGLAVLIDGNATGKD